MKIVIVGGGKVGYYLVKTLLPFEHIITLIEKDKKLCYKISTELGISVYNGDGTNIEALNEAGAGDTDVFIAVTGKDEANLISCQLAKRNFGINRTISNVNNPKNISIFKELGIDSAISSTSIISELIEREVDFAGMKTLMKLRSGQVVITEIYVKSTSPVCEKKIKDLNIPAECVLISIIRDEEVILPNGFTVIKNGDCVISISSENDQKILKEFFVGK